MPAQRAIRIVICSALAVAGLSVAPPPAQAAVASGNALAGGGGGTCAFTLSCTAFEWTCSLTAANDIDASVRRAAIGGQKRTITWSAVEATFAGKLVVVPFDASCDALMNAVYLRSGAPMTYPAGTAYIAVWPQSPFANLEWRMN